MKEILLGHGILTWDGSERRTGRYGTITLDDTDFAETVKTPSHLDVSAIEQLCEQRVTLKAVVVESRQSGHAGDRFLDIYPSTPLIGDTIIIGTGKLFVIPISWGNGLSIGLQPQDGREEQWIDPGILYRLHDQTIQLFATTTDQPDHDAPNIYPICESGAITNGDGTIQIRSKKPLGKKIFIKPKFEKIADGLFAVHRPDDSPGEVFEIDTNRSEDDEDDYSE
jgi:hypothetical protein